MVNSMQHHHVVLVPQADKINEARELLLQCERQVALKQSEDGPSSWCASFDEDKQHFHVDALFLNQQAVEFHQDNIQSIVNDFGKIMAAPPQTQIKSVFCNISK